MERVPGCLTDAEMIEHRAECNEALEAIHENWLRLVGRHKKSLLIIGDAEYPNAEQIALDIAYQYSRVDLANRVHEMHIQRGNA